MEEEKLEVDLESDAATAPRCIPGVLWSRQPRLRNAVYLFLVVMITSAITLSVLTLQQSKIARVIHNLDSREAHLNNGFRDSIIQNTVLSLQTSAPIPGAAAEIAGHVEKLQEYADHRSRHRRSLLMREILQTTDNEFKKYKKNFQIVAAYIASLEENPVDMSEMGPLLQRHNAATVCYKGSLDDGLKDTQRAVDSTAILQIILTCVLGAVLVTLVCVAAREAQDSRELDESSKALLDNLGVAAFVLQRSPATGPTGKPMVTIVDVSKAAVRVFGYVSKRDIIGKPIDLLLPGFVSENAAPDSSGDDNDPLIMGSESPTKTPPRAPWTSSTCWSDSFLLAPPSSKQQRNTAGPSAIRGVTKRGETIDLVRTTTETGRETTTVVCQDVTTLLSQRRDLDVAHKVHRQFAHELRSKHACASHELEAIRAALFLEQRSKNGEEIDDDAKRGRAVLAKHDVTFESITAAMTLLHEADALIESRLDLYKVYQGAYRTEPNCQIIDQSALLQSRVDVVKALAGSGNVDFNVATPSDLADKSIKLDCYVFSHIANNLLSNARKHTSAGSVSLSFLGPQQPRKSTNDPPLLLFSVKDTGRGIPEDIKIRLFKEEATSADVRGVGLGLMSCRVFAEAIGGACWLQSTRTYLETETPGTEFRFALPGCIVTGGANTDDDVSETGAGLPRRLRVVIVEDSAMLRRMIKAKFAAVAAAGNIVDLAMVEHATVEAVLPHMHTFVNDPRTIVTVDQNLDTQGGVLKGSDLIPTLRKAGFNGLIISCSGDIDVAQEHLDAGANLVWGKPFPNIRVILASLSNFYAEHILLYPSPPSTQRCLGDEGSHPTSHACPTPPSVLAEKT